METTTSELSGTNGQEAKIFSVGDSVVYPTHGLATVERIETRTISGEAHSFYVLNIKGKDMAVMVPTENAERVGLREVIDPDDVPRVFEVLDGKAEPGRAQWHHRYQDNVKKLKSGSIFQTAEVVRDLYWLKNEKSLATKESRLMDNAKQLIVAEVAHAGQLSETEVEQKIDEILEQ
jgi:CarD family transcriptional regulator